MKIALQVNGVLLWIARRMARVFGAIVRTLPERVPCGVLAIPTSRRLRIVTAPGGAPPGLENRERMWEWLDRA